MTASSGTVSTVFVGGAGDMSNLTDAAIYEALIAAGNIALYGHLNGVYSMVVDGEMKTLTSDWSSSAPGVAELGADTGIAVGEITVTNNTASTLDIKVGTTFTTASGLTFVLVAWPGQPGIDADHTTGANGYISGGSNLDDSYYSISAGQKVQLMVEAASYGNQYNVAANSIVASSLAGLTVNASNAMSGGSTWTDPEYAGAGEGTELEFLSDGSGDIQGLFHQQGYYPSEANVNFAVDSAWTANDLASWIGYVNNARAEGILNLAPIMSANGLDVDYTSSFATSGYWSNVRAAALYGGGLAFDTPPWFFNDFTESWFTAEGRDAQDYVNLIEQQIQWATSEGLRTSIIVSPNYSASGTESTQVWDNNLLSETKKMVAILQAADAMPSQFIVENYSLDSGSNDFSETAANSLNDVALYLSTIATVVSVSESGLELSGSSSVDMEMNGIVKNIDLDSLGPVLVYPDNVVGVTSTATNLSLSIILSGGGILKDSYASVSADGLSVSSTGTAEQIQQAIRSLTITDTSLSLSNETITIVMLDSSGSVMGTTALTMEVVSTNSVSLPNVTATLAHDSGSSATDGVTNTDALTGTAAAGDTVTVSSGSSVLGTTIASSSGSWNFTPTGLADGSYTLTASDTDAAGNTGSAAVSFTLDTKAPTVTIALAHDTGSSATDGVTNTDALTGTAAAGDTVTVSSGSSVLGTTIASSSGSWNFTPTGLADGSYTLTASDTDAAGNTGSANVAFTIDTETVEAASLEEVATSTGSAQPQVTGTATAGDTVSVYDGSTLLGTTAATAKGSYSFSVPTMLAVGTHALTAIASDAAGNLSAASATLSVTVATGNSYTASYSSSAGNIVMTWSYASNGQYTAVTTTTAAGLVLQTVSPTTTVRNIYDSAGTLIGIVSEAGSATGTASPGFTTQSLAAGALTTTDATPATVTLLAESQTLTLTGEASIVIDSGDDTISAGSGSVSASGGSGNLTFWADSGTSTVSGGTGTLTLLGGSGGGLYTGGQGGANLLAAGSGNTTLIGGSGSDMILAGSGNTTIVGSTGGSDTIVGGSGSSQITASANDIVYGSSGQSTVWASGGNDVVVAIGGSDQMDASGSNDILFAGSGADTMFSGRSSATMVGGTGVTLMVADSGNTDFIGGSGQSSVWGGTGTDLIWTGSGRMLATESQEGNDTVILQSGSSTIHGGLGQDVYDVIDGGAGGDATIYGFKVGTDSIALYGYDTPASQSVVGSSTILGLSDGTTITLVGVTNLTSGSIM